MSLGIDDRPGGMRIAIESAALAAWQALACQIESTSLADVSDPLKSPPAPPRIPPGRPKSTVHLDFVIFISLGTGLCFLKITKARGEQIFGRPGGMRGGAGGQFRGVRDLNL